MFFFWDKSYGSMNDLLSYIFNFCLFFFFYWRYIQESLSNMSHKEKQQILKICLYALWAFSAVSVLLKHKIHLCRSQMTGTKKKSQFIWHHIVPVLLKRIEKWIVRVVGISFVVHAKNCSGILKINLSDYKSNACSL